MNKSRMAVNRPSYLTNDALLISVSVTFIRFIVNGVSVISYLNATETSASTKTIWLLRATLVGSTATVALGFIFYWTSLLPMRWLNGSLLCNLSLIACLASTACLSLMCTELGEPDFVLMQSFDPLVLFAFIITADWKGFILPIALLPFAAHSITHAILVGFRLEVFMTLLIATSLLLGVGYMLRQNIYVCALDLIKAELDPHSAALRLPCFRPLTVKARQAIETFYFRRLTESEATLETLRTGPTSTSTPSRRLRNVTYCREMAFRRRTGQLLGACGRPAASVGLSEGISACTQSNIAPVQQEPSNDWLSETWGHSCDDGSQEDTLSSSTSTAKSPVGAKWVRIKEQSQRNAAVLLERMEALAWAQIRRDIRIYRQREILGSARTNSTAPCTRIMTQLRLQLSSSKRVDLDRTIHNQSEDSDSSRSRNSLFGSPPFVGVSNQISSSSLNSNWLDKASAQLVDRRRASRRSTANTSFEMPREFPGDKISTATSDGGSESLRGCIKHTNPNGLSLDYLNFSGRRRLNLDNKRKNTSEPMSSKERRATYVSDSGYVRGGCTGLDSWRSSERPRSETFKRELTCKTESARLGARRSPTALSLNSYGKTTSESAGVSMQDSMSYITPRRHFRGDVRKGFYGLRIIRTLHSMHRTFCAMRRRSREKRLLVDFATWRSSPLMPFQAGFFPRFVSPHYERWWQDWHEATRNKSPRYRFVRVLGVAIANCILAGLHMIGLKAPSSALARLDLIYIAWTLCGQCAFGVIEMTMAYMSEDNAAKADESVCSQVKSGFVPQAHHFHRIQLMQVCLSIISLFVLLIKVRNHNPKVNMTLVLSELLFNVCLPFLTTELPAFVLAAWATCVSAVTAGLIVWAWGSVSLPRDLIVLVSIWEVTFIVYFWHSRLVTLCYRRTFAVAVLPVVIYLNEIASAEFLPAFMSASEVDGKRVLPSQSPYLKESDCPDKPRSLRRGREDYTKRGLESWMNI